MIPYVRGFWFFPLTDISGTWLGNSELTEDAAVYEMNMFFLL